MVPSINVASCDIALCDIAPYHLASYDLTMHHSLRDRFRGTLLGAALGETLGVNCHHQRVVDQRIAWTTVDRWGFQEPAAIGDFGWDSLVLQHINRLLPSPVKPPGKSPAESLESERGDDLGILTTPTNEPSPIADRSSDSFNAAGLAVATIPIALFYHDDLNQLQHHLEQVLAASQQTPQPLSSSTMGAIVVGYTIALALRETLHPQTLIPQLLTDLNIRDRDPKLAQQLVQIQDWLEQGVGLAHARTLVQETDLNTSHSTPITLAFYSFLSTPENVRLTLLRTARLLHQPQLSCTIAGAIAGAYNSTTGMPFVWQRPLNLMSASSSTSSGTSFSAITQQEPTLDQAMPVRHRLRQLLQHADLLLAAWSGVHAPIHWFNALPTSAVTAAPSLIRHNRHNHH